MWNFFIQCVSHRYISRRAGNRKGIVSGSGLNRRDFLQIVGLGGTGMVLSACGNTSIESGVELGESYVQPENFVVPRGRCLLCIDVYAMRLGMRNHGPGP